jgi:hypothetical protein
MSRRFNTRSKKNRSAAISAQASVAVSGQPTADKGRLAGVFYGRLPPCVRCESPRRFGSKRRHSSAYPLESSETAAGRDRSTFSRHTHSTCEAVSTASTVSRKRTSRSLLRTNWRKCWTALDTKASRSRTIRIVLWSGQPVALTGFSVPRANSSRTSRFDSAVSPKPAPTRRLIVSGHHTSITFRTCTPSVWSHRLTSARVSEAGSR